MTMLTWHEDQVTHFLHSIGINTPSNAIHQHAITGDVLSLLSLDDLKDLGIHSLGNRLTILKHVYQLKLQQHLPLEDGCWLPSHHHQSDVDRLYDLVNEQNQRIAYLEQEYQTLHDSLHPAPINLSTPNVARQPSFKWANFGRNQTAETPPPAPPADDSTPSSSTESRTKQTPPSKPPPPAALSIPLQTYSQSSSPSTPTLANQRSISTPTHSTEDDKKPAGVEPEGPRTSKSSRASPTAVLGTAENPQRFKVTLEDPCWKVLPAALKKYKINDDWRMYALFICYGNTGGTGTGTERCLSYDEKPLLLFQKLKEANQSPVFMLRHIRDIKSPIAIAQSKAQSKASVPAFSGLPSPEPNANASSSNPHPAVPTYARPIRAKSNGKSAAEGADDGVTYAVGIYPYLAEREDEFNVNVDDTFVILSKAKGWWAVERDPTGTGSIVPDVSKANWVPAGCLLECLRPPGFSSSSSSSPGSPLNGSFPRMLRLDNILSTSFPGVALMDYQSEKREEEEMGLTKGDVVWVFKRYSHWSYAVKEDTGERGWVPSWFIGSQPSSSTTLSSSSSSSSAPIPYTPSAETPPALSSTTRSTPSAEHSSTPDGSTEILV